jgi:hypothetical protein
MNMHRGVDVLTHIFSTSVLVSFTLLERASWYQLVSRLGGPQGRSGRHGEKKILQPTGIGQHYTYETVPEQPQLKKHRGLSPRENYIDRKTAACRRS